MHGGALMGLAGAAGGWSAFLDLPDGSTGTATVDSTTHFLRGVSAGHVEAAARPLHAGRSVIVIGTEVRDADGRPVGRVTRTRAVLR
nr:PaaI family thioesterase [Pseudonocardia acidicola]